MSWDKMRSSSRPSRTWGRALPSPAMLIAPGTVHGPGFRGRPAPLHAAACGRSLPAGAVTHPYVPLRLPVPACCYGQARLRTAAATRPCVSPRLPVPACCYGHAYLRAAAATRPCVSLPLPVPRPRSTGLQAVYVSIVDSGPYGQQPYRDRGKRKIDGLKACTTGIGTPARTVQPERFRRTHSETGIP